MLKWHKFDQRYQAHFAQDQLFVSLHHSKFPDAIPQAILISSSPKKVLLRTAAFESIIAKYVTRRLLQSVFPWTDPEGKEPSLLECILQDFARTYLQRGVVFRSLISILEREIEANVSDQQ
jgi:hypothetical protein